MKKAACIGAAVLAVAAVLFLFAEGTDLFAQQGPWGGSGGRRPGGRMPGLRGMLGGSAMTECGGKLYVLSAGHLYKVNPVSLTVENSLRLQPPREEPREEDGGEGK